nr:uncharacterized protein LOC109186882 [Ipomoea trifida]
MAKQFLTCCFLSPSPSSSLSPAPTRIRPRKRLHPIGLLPTNARGYSLNQTTGRFVLFLDDNLVFEVGMVTAKYPSENFDDSPESISMHFLPWFYETGEKEDGAMKLGSKELNIDIGDTPLVCANAVVQSPGSIGFEEWVGRVKTSLENVDEILFFDEAKQEVALFFGKGYEKLGHQEYNGAAGEVVLREAVEMFSNKLASIGMKLRDDSGPVVESQGKSENVEGPKMDKIVESGFRDYTVSYKSKLVEDQGSSSKSVSKEDGSKKKKAKAWDMKLH